jgi:two-component system, chemotaxis family, chemotaxis protein CheY
MKILLADDDSLMRTLVNVSLGSVKGVEIVEAVDGDQAWDLLSREQFDAVVLDWQMPGRSGLDLVKAVRAQGSRVPIVMITGESKRERVVEAIRAGISEYVIKPFDFKLLLSKLAKHCKGLKELTLGQAAAPG